MKRKGKQKFISSIQPAHPLTEAQMEADSKAAKAWAKKNKVKKLPIASADFSSERPMGKRTVPDMLGRVSR